MTIPLDTVVILRHDWPLPAAISGRSAYLTYALWTGSAWQLLRLDVALGTCRSGPAFASFHEAARAWRAGITWGA